MNNKLGKLKWYYNRLKLMTFEEVICYRIPQLIKLHITGRLKLRRIEILDLNNEFKGALYDKVILNLLFKEWPFNKCYKVFTENLDILTFSEWRMDLSSRKTSPIKYYGNIKRQNYDINGDVKFISEVSRFEFLPFIAFKFLESGDFNYLNRIESILFSWNIQNPFLKSINWTSGIEVGIRSVNIVYTHLILNESGAFRDNKNIDFIIRQLLSYSYDFLKNHLSLYSSANNHLMAELMGLNVLSSYLNVKEKEKEEWRARFFNEIEKQIVEDGVHMERSTRYHAEVTDQILIGLEFIKNSGENVPSKVSKIIKRLFEFTSHVVYCNNNITFGDNDEGSVVNPFFDESFSLYKSQLASCNYLFHTDYTVTKKIDFRNYLIFGSRFKNYESIQKESDTLFEKSGFCFMYDHERQTKLSFDCGTIGDEISAAHGHSAVFHFNLEVDGVCFFVDPGTYQYHSIYEKWRNYFRGITAHNTISINRKDHAKNNGRMSWVDCPNVIIDEFKLSEIESYCKATTNAFEGDGVIHSRIIRFLKKEKRIEITDVLSMNKTNHNKLSFYLHFHPDVSLIHKGNIIEAKNSHVKISIYNNSFKEAKIYRGSSHPLLGWFSNEFNKMRQTSSLNFEIETSTSSELKTIIYY